MKSVSRASRSFTLVEILAATAILSIMFTIMFGILQQTSNGWQAANRRVEASQAARLALEQIAYDLENCVAVRRVGQPVPGLGHQTGNQALTNLAYGFAFSNAPSATPSWVAQSISQPNDMIFVVTPRRNSLPNAGEDLQETGYVPVWVTRTAQGTPGYGNVRIGRYALLRHFPTTNLVQTTGGQRITNLVPMNDFMANALAWETTPGIEDPKSKNFIPIVDNCVGFDIKFSYTNAAGQRFTDIPTWGRPNLTLNAPVGERWSGNPTGIDGLPQSATITMCVLDDRTAERIYRLQSNGLSVAQISNLVAAVTNPASFESIADNPPGIRATLRQGMIGFQREVFFKNSP
jgi:type II secretory pathway pseudopilin PulG